MVPIYDESFKEMEEIRADDSIEIGTIQDDGVVCNGEGVIHENIAENLDGDISRESKLMEPTIDSASLLTQGMAIVPI